MSSVRIQLRRGTATQWTVANPVLALGEPGHETDTRRVKIGDGATAWNALAYFTTPKSVTIAEPQASDEFTLFYTEYPTTLTQVQGVVRGTASPGATVEIRYAADRSAAGTLATVSTAITSTTTGQAVTAQNMPIPADRYVWLKVTAVTGVVSEVNVAVEL
jgi:SH3-like domain-containing protein